MFEKSLGLGGGASVELGREASLRPKPAAREHEGRCCAILARGCYGNLRKSVMTFDAGIYRPALTSSNAPFTYEAASESSHTIASATSSAVPARARRVCAHGTGGCTGR